MNPSCRLLIGSGENLIEPVLSIAIPTFQRFDMLKEALDSVFALNFTIPVEVIIVDNDPSNEPNLLQSMRDLSDKHFSYYKNDQNLGMVDNWNQCLRLAKGKYITILHDDDMLSLSFADEINKMLSTEGRIRNIFGFRSMLLDQRCNKPVARKSSINNLINIVSKKLSLRKNYCTEKTAVDFFISNQFCGTVGVVMNREVAISLGGFDPLWYPISDYEFWCRWVSIIGSIPIIDKSVGLYRMRENESMRYDVREAFISMSTRLRKKMISAGFVPKTFGRLVSYLSKVQSLSISRDWRVQSDKNTSRLDIFNIFICRILSSILPVFFASKNTMEH